MERHARSNLIKLLFSDDESVVSSTICDDLADQNQIQSQDYSHGSQAIDISEDDIVQNEESEGVTKTHSCFDCILTIIIRIAQFFGMTYDHRKSSTGTISPGRRGLTQPRFLHSNHATN